jgi:hypothetical protein
LQLLKTVRGPAPIERRYGAQNRILREALFHQPESASLLAFPKNLLRP